MSILTFMEIFLVTIWLMSILCNGGIRASMRGGEITLIIGSPTPQLMLTDQTFPQKRIIIMLRKRRKHMEGPDLSPKKIGMLWFIFPWLLDIYIILRNSASSFHWLSSSIFTVCCSSRIGNTSSHLHYMMFQTIQTIYFL